MVSQHYELGHPSLVLCQSLTRGLRPLSGKFRWYRDLRRAVLVKFSELNYVTYV